MKHLITLDVEQGTPEWMAGRVGIPTASNFDRILTASCKPSAQADEYLFELVAEWVHGDQKFFYITPAMQTGIDREPEARAAYEFITGEKVKTTGIIYQDESRLVGCSPDGLLKKKGLEIKCPEPVTHLSYLLQGVCPKKYLPQVQGSMWVSGCKQWDFMSYHPDYESLIITVDADPVWQTALYKALPEFITKMKKERRKPLAAAMRKGRLAGAKHRR